MSRLVDIKSEELWQILFDEACVEGNQAERIKNELNKISVEEKEIRNKSIDEFVERLKSDEFQKYNLDMVFETSRDLSYSNCVNAFCEYIDKIAEEMRGAE